MSKKIFKQRYEDEFSNFIKYRSIVPTIIHQEGKRKLIFVKNHKLNLTVHIAPCPEKQTCIDNNKLEDCGASVPMQSEAQFVSENYYVLNDICNQSSSRAGVSKNNNNKTT